MSVLWWPQSVYHILMDLVGLSIRRVELLMAHAPPSGRPNG